MNKPLTTLEAWQRFADNWDTLKVALKDAIGKELVPRWLKRRLLRRAGWQPNMNGGWVKSRMERCLLDTTKIAKIIGCANSRWWHGHAPRELIITEIRFDLDIARYEVQPDPCSVFYFEDRNSGMRTYQYTRQLIDFGKVLP